MTHARSSTVSRSQTISWLSRRVGVMAARTASIRQACDIPTTRGMADDAHHFSRSYLATDAAVKQLHRCLREHYSLGVQARIWALYKSNRLPGSRFQIWCVYRYQVHQANA